MSELRTSIRSLLEPEASIQDLGLEHRIQMSIAISLRRIADTVQATIPTAETTDDPKETNSKV